MLLCWTRSNAKQREAKFGNLREWSLSSLAQNRPTIQKQFCLCYGKLRNRSRSLLQDETLRKLLMTSNFGCFALLCVQSKRTLKQLIVQILFCCTLLHSTMHYKLEDNARVLRNPKTCNSMMTLIFPVTLNSSVKICFSNTILNCTFEDDKCHLQ